MARTARYSLEAIAAVILLIWRFSWIVIPVGSNLVHLLLVVLLVVIVIRVLEDRRPLP